MYLFSYLHAYEDWSEREIWQLSFLFEFFSLKLLIFRLVITYLGRPRLHQITPFLSKNFRGSMHPDPCTCITKQATVCGVVISFENGLQNFAFAKIYLKPKVTLHFELWNISLLFLSLTKLNIAMSCWFPP